MIEYAFVPNSFAEFILILLTMSAIRALSSKILCIYIIVVINTCCKNEWKSRVHFFRQHYFPDNRETETETTRFDDTVHSLKLCQYSTVAIAKVYQPSVAYHFIVDSARYEKLAGIKEAEDNHRDNHAVFFAKDVAVELFDEWNPRARGNSSNSSCINRIEMLSES